MAGMARLRLLLTLALFSTTCSASSRRDAPAFSEPSATYVAPAALRAQIAVLASDKYEGRYPGTPGGQRTETYIAAALSAVGLQPGAPGGGWEQPVRIPAGGMLSGITGARTGAHNIIGRVPGSDPAAGTVLLTAHWDHLGHCRTIALDRICNGAVDNASGVATPIEVARAIAAGPRPVRDVYFIATTGEEEGEIGAKALVAAPPVPLASIVAAFNLDCTATAPSGAPVAIIGRGRTQLDPLIFATAKAMHRTVDKSGWANRYVKRQDGWQLLQHGVPAVMFGGVFGDRASFQAYMDSRYHRPDDDLAHLGSLDGAAEDADLHVAVIRAVADPARWPPARDRSGRR